MKAEDRGESLRPARHRFLPLVSFPTPEVRLGEVSSPVAQELTERAEAEREKGPH